MQLYQLIYVSKSAYPMSKTDLAEILNTSCHSNSERLITGLLVYDSGHFIQVLEGEYNEVESLFAHIQQDKRHNRVKRILSCYIKERFFPEWNMGFYNLEEMVEFDFFKLRKRIESLYEICSPEKKKSLGMYALKMFFELKEKTAVAV
ncbi:BLUF domain-containing protein [Gimesia aquarii]|uniref:Blue light-and temperature-regulated antirepressor YcgF n=1 Tax=Gimesia aquarii TaxID=2527964 RepID=A0A517WWY5_9PLAN|nr:BLUF domain-containing protein [Gimesia aquarii]QDU09771.1 Blue light- and temperature-regulated antirepressor YcgF [Gimesia aquarii]